MELGANTAERRTGLNKYAPLALLEAVKCAPAACSLRMLCCLSQAGRAVQGRTAPAHTAASQLPAAD